jgi:hypothetical protein
MFHGAHTKLGMVSKTDQEMLSQVPPGEPPPPTFYDLEVHRKTPRRMMLERGAHSNWA